MRIGGIVAAAAIVASLVADAQAPTFVCDKGKPCTTSSFSYMPGDRGLTAFGAIAFSFDDWQVKEIGTRRDADGDMVTVLTDACAIGMKRGDDPFPAASANSRWRVDLARQSTEPVNKLPNYSALSGAEVFERRADPTIGVVDAVWVSISGLWYARRVVAAGERWLVIKMCEGKTRLAAEQAVEMHRVDVPFGQ